MKKPFGWILALALLGVAAAAGEIVETKAKAEAGDIAAQLELAKIHEKGEGVVRDQKAAISWYVKAAEQGNEEAQMYLAALYIRGERVPKNSTEAAKWYSLAAEQGNVTAQCQIGRMHMMGAGVPKDDVQAYKWSNLAAARGDASAKKVVSLLEARMSRPQVAEAQELARLYLEMKKLDLPLNDVPNLEALDPSTLEPVSP
jgi:uncharacterized protein